MHIGSQRFGDIHRGVPLMSRSLLSKRLQELEKAGIIVRSDSGAGHDVYRLSPAGEELAPLVLQLGNWGKKWTRSELTARELDAGLLMWDMQRRIETRALPEGQTVVHFLYQDAPVNRRRWWLIMDRESVDLCIVDPGVEPDLTVTTQVGTMTGIWMGDISYSAALQSGELELVGPTALRNGFVTWLRFNYYADIERQV
jgi:DNA-binding HxlR family transcriptional regulator